MARHELWVELADRPGNLATLAGELAACGANIVHLDVHAGPADTVIDRLVVDVADTHTGQLLALANARGAILRRFDERRPPGRDRPRRPAPTTLERLVMVDDGGLVRLRHLRAGDRAAVADHCRRCAAAGQAPEAEDDERVALAALVGSHIVGLAWYERDHARDTVRPSVMVDDRHRRRGIGALLVDELAVLAARDSLVLDGPVQAPVTPAGSVGSGAGGR
jgi:GNAT superfamily N-acetyltransferase